MLAGLLASLLLHLAMLAATERVLPVRPGRIEFPIEAHISPEPVLVPQTPIAPPERRARRETTRQEGPQPESPSQPSPEPAAEVHEPAQEQPGSEGHIATMPVTAAPDAWSAPELVAGTDEVSSQGAKDGDIPDPALRMARRELPEKLEIRYAVGVGEGGFVAGEAVYHWHVRSGRYSLVSTIRPTGVTALFVHGRIVQVSEGEVDASGLRPEHYWMKRGERKQDTAQFIWSQNRLVMNVKRGTHDLLPQSQDLLSFPFHLAMTATADEPEFILAVANGRRYKRYLFRGLGNETIELGGQPVTTLHIQGRREGDGILDVWLDPDRYGLPVKVRTLDMKGDTMMLELRALSGAED
jgi:hypothetical protein